MARGTARRARIGNVGELAELINRMRSCEALALGRLREDLPETVEVMPKRMLDQANGTPRPDLIARAGTDIVYRRDAVALALLDFDTKGMPADVAARIRERGGFWGTLESVIPELAGVARVLRHSTSTGLYRTDTSEKLAGSNGVHVFLTVRNGADIVRFLRALHARCQLAGFGHPSQGSNLFFVAPEIASRSAARTRQWRQPRQATNRRRSDSEVEDRNYRDQVGPRQARKGARHARLRA
jgi:hypothetical protein